MDVVDNIFEEVQVNGKKNGYDKMPVTYGNDAGNNRNNQSGNNNGNSSNDSGNGSNSNDLLYSVANGVSSLNIKLVIFIFIIFILLGTDTYNKYVMSSVPGAMSDGKLTLCGLVAKSAMFVILYVLVDCLICRSIL